MFLQDTGGNNTDPRSLTEIINNFTTEFKNMQSSILNFETQAKKVTADIFGRGEVFADDVRKSMAAAALETAKFGVGVDGIAETYGAIAQQLRTNVMLTDEQLTTFLAFQEATNITAEQMGILVEGFATLGVGPTEAAKQMSDMAKTSRQYGLNTAQFMEKVGENLKLMNSYNFRDGVEGFTRMVARSQALRINMADVTGLAAKLLDPSEAINLAAQFQVLGGAVGALADPFQLMNMAQNDLEGLQNTILEAASAAVTFNETTGKFQIGATEMRRLRAQADALGMDYEELANTAVKTAERNQKLDYLQFLDATEEQKDLLASLGQLENGELKVKIKEKDEEGKLKDKLISAADALKNPKYMEQLKNVLDINNKSDIEIAQEQLTTLQRIDIAIRDSLKRSQAIIAGGKTYDTLTNNLEKNAKVVTDVTDKLFANDGVLMDGILKFNDAASGAFQQIFNDIGEIDSADDLYRAFETVGDKFTDVIKEKLTQMNLSSIGGALGLGGGNFNFGSYFTGNTRNNQTGNNTNNSGLNIPTPNRALPVDLVKVTTTDPIKIDPLTMNFDPLTVNHGGTIQLQGVGGVDINNLTATQLQELSTKLKTYMDPSNILGT